MTTKEINRDGISRRQCLRYAFYASTATASATLFSACGDDSSNPVANSSVPMGGNELNIPRGPLANVGSVSLDTATQIRIPDGFSIRAIATSRMPVSTPGGAGINTLPFLWHHSPDGGATYALDDGGWIYTSNAEVAAGFGGCSSIRFGADGSVIDAYPILTGTSSNCAGGKTPWNTWVSCEETSSGQSWECDPFAESEGIAKPALGFFSHEAIAVDPVNQVVYLTEDSDSGRFYRWVADPTDADVVSGRLAMETGVLQVMNIQGFADNQYPEDTDTVRTLRPVSWVDVVRPGEAQETVRSELASDNQPVPGTIFNGGEGLWYYELPADVLSIPEGGSVATRGLIFFTCKGDNRVYALDIENQLVELIFDNEQIEPDFGDVDNLTISPAGDVLVAEDPPMSLNSRIMVVLPNEQAVVLVVCEHPGSEICGPAFSPDGSRLYFSSQRRYENAGGETYELTIPESFRS